MCVCVHVSQCVCVPYGAVCAVNFQSRGCWPDDYGNACHTGFLLFLSLLLTFLSFSWLPRLLPDYNPCRPVCGLHGVIFTGQKRSLRLVVILIVLVWLCSDTSHPHSHADLRPQIVPDRYRLPIGVKAKLSPRPDAPWILEHNLSMQRAASFRALRVCQA